MSSEACVDLDQIQPRITGLRSKLMFQIASPSVSHLHEEWRAAWKSGKNAGLNNFLKYEFLYFLTMYIYID